MSCLYYLNNTLIMLFIAKLLIKQAVYDDAN